jgi:hypothetical protein
MVLVKTISQQHFRLRRCDEYASSFSQGELEISKKQGDKRGKRESGSKDDLCYGCGPDEWGEHSKRVWAAVDESARRFLEANEQNIRSSDKEKIASASYSGAMIDMMMILKAAMGKWAVGQVVGELEAWHRSVPCGGRPRVKVSVEGDVRIGDVSPEEAKDLGEQIARWLEERKTNGKKQGKDPMFA